MTRVYQELLSVRRDANEMYLVPVPARLVGMDFVAAASVFLPERTDLKACLLIGIHRGDAMMLNPVGGEAVPLREGDQLILLSHTVPALSGLQPSGVASMAQERPPHRGPPAIDGGRVRVTCAAIDDGTIHEHTFRSVNCIFFCLA